MLLSVHFSIPGKCEQTESQYASEYNMHYVGCIFEVVSTIMNSLNYLAKSLACNLRFANAKWKPNVVDCCETTFFLD